MPKRRWPTQNEPNGVLVDFFLSQAHIALFGLKKNLIGLLLVYCSS